jgi:hypothetical protein
MTMISRRSMSVVLAVAALACAMTAPAWAQAPQEKPAPPPKLPAKVDVVISRYQGEKKVSSQPYTIVLNTTGSPTSLRLNVSTPMGVETTISKDGDKTTSTRYQSIGTSIDCRVSWTTPTAGNPVSDTFDVNVNLNDSSLFNPEGDTKVPVSAMAIMSFSANNTLTMRNGQTMLLTTATNKVTGEVIKVEVTFTLLK